MKRAGSRQRLLSVVAVAGLLSACARTEPPAAAAAWPRCSNPVAGYKVAFPRGWRSNTDGVMEPCSLFDPQSVAVEAGTEIPHAIAVVIVREDAPLAEAAEGYRAVEVVAERALQVAGRNALQIEVIDPEPISGDRFLRSLHYLIEKGPETLVASSYAEGRVAYAEKRQILDRMVRSLTFDGPPGGQ